MSDPRQRQPSDSTAKLCALKYRSSRLPADRASEFVFLLAVNRHGSVSLYASPGMQSQIPLSKRVYINDLLLDLVKRAQDSPDEVFEELCQLSVGPIVTDSVVEIENPETAIAKLYPGFASLPSDGS